MSRYLKHGVLLLGLLLLVQGCASSMKSDLNAAQRVAKKLMERQAAPTVSELFGANYNAAGARLVKAWEIRKWVERNCVDVSTLPKPVRMALRNDCTLGLHVPEIVLQGPMPGKPRARLGDGIFIPIWGSPKFDGWWIHAGGPCNGDFCVNCTGFSGPSTSGLMCACVCTNSCEDCAPCPACPPCP